MALDVATQWDTTADSVMAETTPEASALTRTSQAGMAEAAPSKSLTTKEIWTHLPVVKVYHKEGTSEQASEAEPPSGEVEREAFNYVGQTLTLPPKNTL